MAKFEVHKFQSLKIHKLSLFSAPISSAPPSSVSSITITSNNRPLITPPTITSGYSARSGQDATQPSRHNDTAATEVTLPLRQRVSATKEAEGAYRHLLCTILLSNFLYFVVDDKENENKSGQATQGLIQRRRRPKRRSTGVVHLDADVRVFLPSNVVF